jgi:hypothetical protein
MMADHRLKETTEAVRNAVARTRIHAIDTGSVYQFRVEPRGRHFIAVPTDAAALPANIMNGGSLPPSAVEVGQLDEGFSFEVVAATAAAGSAVPMTLASSDQAFSGMVSKIHLSQDFGSSNWSPPIVFQPDGRAIDASFNIVDQHGDGFRVRVRELTGEVFVERRQ